jgi:hypothetical protein
MEEVDFTPAFFTAETLFCAEPATDLRLASIEAGAAAAMLPAVAEPPSLAAVCTSDTIESLSSLPFEPTPAAGSGRALLLRLPNPSVATVAANVPCGNDAD